MRWTMIDMQVFREASLSAFAGAQVYDGGFTSASLPFLYPPFALIVLWPIAAVPLEAAKIAMTVLNLAALGVLCWRSAVKVVPNRAWAHPLAVGCAAILLVCEPMQQNLQMGQVNAIIAAVVLVDFTLPKDSRLKGLLTGAMAGVKLTPALFGVYYLVSGQRRAALNSALSFFGSVLLSWVVFPSATLAYWTSVVFQSRIGPAHLGNQSLLGVMDRVANALSWSPRFVTVVWVIAAAGIALAVLSWLRRSGLDDVATFGALSLTILLVSPLSWTPHWVSAVPLVIWAASRRPTIRSAGLVLLGIGLALFAWPVDGVPSGLIWFVYPAGFVAPSAPGWHTLAYWTLSAFYTVAGIAVLLTLGKRWDAKALRPFAAWWRPVAPVISGGREVPSHDRIPTSKAAASTK